MPPGNRLIHSEPFNVDGEVKRLSSAFIPPSQDVQGNSNTFSATYALLSGGPVYFRAIEGESPSDSDVPVEVGDELDVIGSEDLRLVKFFCPTTSIGVMSYYGSGDQV